MPAFSAFAALACNLAEAGLSAAARLGARTKWEDHIMIITAAEIDEEKTRPRLEPGPVK